MKRIITSPRQFRVLALLAAAALGMGLLTLVASEEQAEAAFPGQNGKIAFVGIDSEPESDTEIYGINPDGSGLTNITNNTDHPDESFEWSPGGSKIAFSSRREENASDSWDIYTMNADGSNPTQITIDDYYDSQPTWSPDGSKIAFQRYVHPLGYEIFAMNADGSNQTNITNNAYHDTQPTWSPDGSKIAFVSHRDSQANFAYAQIFTMNPDGSDQTNITTNTEGDSWNVEPNWSPDGSKIAFSSNKPSLDGYQIYTMNPDGSNQTNITNDPETVHHYPVWSPDGSKIAFQSNDEIYTMDADGSNQTPLTSLVGLTADLSLDWQPNTAPIITSLRPLPGSTTTARTPTIAATVSDQQTDLAKANITLTLDGQTIPRAAFSYNRSTDKLTYTSGKKLSLGRHTVRLVAKDEVNLSTTKNWGFEIVHS